MPATRHDVQRGPGHQRGDDPVVHQRGDGVVVAGDDQGRLPDGPQPGQARPAEQRGQPVHGGQRIGGTPDVHRADQLRLGAQPPAEHGAGHPFEPFRTVAARVDEMPHSFEVAGNGEAAEGCGGQHQPANPAGVRERHLLRDRAAERGAEHVGGRYAEFVEHLGAEAGQRPHGQREARHLRPADAGRVEGDRAEPFEMGKEPFPQAYLAPDAGVQQQRLAFAAGLNMDPQPSDT